MIDVAGRWLRVSTAGQDEASQEPDVDRWIAEHGYAVGATYRARAASAFHGKHEPLLRDALEDMKAGKINVLVVWKSDRIDRQEKLGSLLKEAEGYGGRIEFAKEPELNMLTGLGGRVMTVVKEYMNAEESRTKSDRVTIKHAALKAAGSVVGKVAWGYEIEQRDGIKIPVPTTDARVWVPRIHEWSLQGFSLNTIAGMLTGAGVKPRGNAWTNRGVRNILLNPVYAGTHVYGDGTMLAVEAVVTADTQEQARKALRARLRRGQRSSSAEPALLIPKCLACGAKAYRATTGGAGNRRHVYYCRTCGHQLDCDKIDSLVIGAVLVELANEMETEQRWVEGDSSATRAAEIERELRSIPPRDKTQRARIQALYNELDALPEDTPGHFEEAETGRTRADAVAEVLDDRAALRALLAKWDIGFVPEGKTASGWSRVRLSVGGREFTRAL